MPMIDFSVVVLPTPLRPRSVTTSPGWTSKVTPWRMCDSPYQACRSRTASSDSDTAASQVGLHDVRIARHALIVALGDDLAASQHRDGVGQVLHHAQVVLDHQDRAGGGGLLDERGDAADVLVTHAGG